MATQPVNWDEVPDDELTETLWERVEALKGMFPRSLRSKVATTADWSWWAAQKSFTTAKSALWIGSTSAMLMIMPVIIERELAEMAKSQIQQQQQMLLGPLKP